MVPWFHFTGGDHLFIESWRPTSPGAITGACIGLVLLALFDRWFAATRAVLESHWRHRCVLTLLILPKTTNHSRGLALSSRPPFRSGKVSPIPSIETLEKSLDMKRDIKEEPRQMVPPLPNRQANYTRTIPPFIPAHDLPRGIVHGAQALIGYLLMLAVMYVCYLQLLGYRLATKLGHSMPPT
jgi:copper transporter 1